MTAKVTAVLDTLALAIPEPRVELRFRDAWELLIATILSAQSTDKVINEVTPEVFRRWPGPASLAAAPPEEVEEVVKRTGFFRNKAKAIQAASARVAEVYGGRVPRTMEDIVTLPGVARKTGNLVLGAAYGLATGIVVDTHAGRVAQRLGLTTATVPEKIELDLCRVVPEAGWITTGQRLVLHGRYVCTAKKPDCTACPLNELCPSAVAPPAGSVEQRAAAERTRVDDGLDRSLGVPA